MENEIEQLKEVLKIIGELKNSFKLERNSDACDRLLYTGVTQSDIIPALSPMVEKYFGKPYKAAGESAFLKNWFDGFVKAVGGARSEQTLFRKVINDEITVFCAFWPWGSNPIKVSVRIGILCPDDQDDRLSKELKGIF